LDCRLITISRKHGRSSRKSLHTSSGLLHSSAKRSLPLIVCHRGRPAVALAPLGPAVSRLLSLAAFRARLCVRGWSLSAEVAAAREGLQRFFEKGSKSGIQGYPDRFADQQHTGIVARWTIQMGFVAGFAETALARRTVSSGGIDAMGIELPEEPAVSRPAG
jgi:hypothetical protein